MNNDVIIQQLRKELTELQERVKVMEKKWADFEKPVEFEIGTVDHGEHQR